MTPTTDLGVAPIRLVTPDGKALMDPLSGEALIIAAQTDERLVHASVRLDDLAAAARNAKAALAGELRDRMDRSGKWTRRIEDAKSGVQYEVKCPSPQAGTTSIDEEVFGRGLTALVDQGVIDAEAADRALVRTVTVTAQVTIGVDLEAAKVTVVGALERDLEAWETLVGELDASSARKVSKAGVAALRKIGGAARALVDEVTVEGPAPARAVTIRPCAKVKR